MSRTSDKARSKSEWRNAPRNGQSNKGKPYGRKAVRNYNNKSNG